MLNATTLGMAGDQGKTSNLNGLQYVSNIEKKIVPEVGHTTFRPPYTPVTIGTIVGREVEIIIFQHVNLQFILGTKKITLFLLLQAYGSDLDTTQEEQKQ